MREHETAFTEKGARLAAISLGDMDYARIFRAETGINFPLFVDEEKQAYGAAQLRSGSLLHLLRRDNFKARKRAKADGHRQYQMGKDPFQIRDPFQLGASFVFGPDNTDLYAHLSETFGDNAPIAELLHALVRD